MGLRIIYGRAGTGKTRYCINEIKNNISLENKIYIITPEQFSYSAEKELLNSIDRQSVVNAEVISFNRIAHRVSLEVGGANKVHITKARKSYDYTINSSRPNKKFKFSKQVTRKYRYYNK